MSVMKGVFLQKCKIVRVNISFSTKMLKKMRILCKFAVELFVVA